MTIQTGRGKQTQVAALKTTPINITLLSKVTSWLPKSAPQFAFCLPLRWKKRGGRRGEERERNAENRWRSGPYVQLPG